MNEIKEAIEDVKTEINLHYSEPDNYTTEGYRKISKSMNVAISALKTIEWMGSLSKVTDIRPWAVLAKFQEYRREL